MSGVSGLFLLFSAALAAEVSAEQVRLPALNEGIRSELSRRYPGARIDLQGEARWTRGAPRETAKAVNIYAVTPRGEAQFMIRGDRGEDVAEGWIGYSAWLPARIATRRILPGEQLNPESFITQEVNVATGMAYEYRGTILAADEEIGNLEARQTVLEGQFLTAGSVRRIPDIRRGDVVRVHVLSDGVVLSTTGTAEEPGYMNGDIRIITHKTKRELTGRLAAGRIVEVKL